MLKRTILLFTLCCGLLSAHAQVNYSNSRRLIDGWQFLRSDIGNVWEAVRPASPGTPETVPLWTTVSLPHCFNAEDAVDPRANYYQGPGWYKSFVEIDNPYHGGRTLLHFEGAGQKTEVYVYTEKVGSHVGGYDEWSVDITDAVARFRASDAAARFKGKVPVIIRCDNSRDAEMIPSDLSDFNVYGGLYRYLNLVYVPKFHITGVHTDARVDAAGRKGGLLVDVLVTNVPTNADVSVSIFSPDGKHIATQTTGVSAQIKTDEDFSTVLTDDFVDFDFALNKPQLWSPDSPALYTCKVQLVIGKGAAPVATSESKFGFRHFEFVEKGPFKLNGERLLLRGTHRHEDHAGVAAAMTEEMIVAEMELMKAMGVNFIRLGHYQQSRIVLEQCDRLGILVWEEIPWCRGGLGGDTYKEQARRMLTNMITQHRNHPSVILWGLGNENDWPNDFPEFDKQKIRAFMQELHELSHSLDDTRLTSIRRCAFCADVVDVYSPSIWAGWYRGIYTDYKEVSYAEMQKVKRFLHVEWGGDSHAGRHAEFAYAGLDEVSSGGKEADERAGDASLYGGMARASKDGDWSESYICDLIDWHLKEQETMPWLTGAAYWPFKDFSTPVRPENPVPYVNQKGVVERDMTPKESYYVFQSYWTTAPMVHIYGHSWPTRWGREGEKRLVKVYSNCAEVELFLNGVSQGVRKRDSQDFPAAGLHWDVVFAKGANTLEAVAVSGKGRSRVTVKDSVSLEYETRQWSKPARLSITTTPAEDGYVWVNAELRDENGVVCLDSRRYIEFSAVGAGKLIVNQGTSTGSSLVQATNGRARVKLATNGSKSVVAVKSPGLETAFVEVR